MLPTIAAVKRFPIEIIRRASGIRSPGYFEDVMSRGRIDGDNLLLSEWQFLRLRIRYSQPGLGDIVHELLRPVVRVIDRVLGTRLAGCAACNRRRVRLNRWWSRWI
jgi:hypothetical protein